MDAFFEIRRMSSASTSAMPPLGKRIRQARLELGVPQDRLGVMIGIDELAASARISRYESGVHAPPYGTVVLLAKALKVPPAFFYCADDRVAELLLRLDKLPTNKRNTLVDGWISQL